MRRLSADVCLVSCCRYLAGTSHATISKRTTMRLLSSVAGDMFALATSASGSDPYVQAALKCLSLRSDLFSQLRTQMDLIQVRAD